MKDEIRDYLKAHRASDGTDDFGDDESLLELGVIDSMTMIDVIAHLEGRYGIAVDEDDMTPENFDSVEGIATYVAQKLQGTASSTSSSLSGQ
jgi:acyl carrier protein